MTRGSILLGQVAERIEMLEIRCGRCERQGRLNIARLLAEYGPSAGIGDVMHAQIGDCPRRDRPQHQDRCDPYSPDLPRLFTDTKGAE